MKNIDVYEDDFEFLDGLKRCDEEKENFTKIADVVDEVIRGYYLHVVEHQIVENIADGKLKAWTDGKTTFIDKK